MTSLPKKETDADRQPKVTLRTVAQQWVSHRHRIRRAQQFRLRQVETRAHQKTHPRRCKRIELSSHYFARSLRFQASLDPP
jgi:hypothetical protein